MDGLIKDMASAGKKQQQAPQVDMYLHTDRVFYIILREYFTNQDTVTGTDVNYAISAIWGGMHLATRQDALAIRVKFTEPFPNVIMGHFRGALMLNPNEMMILLTPGGPRPRNNPKTFS